MAGLHRGRKELLYRISYSDILKERSGQAQKVEEGQTLMHIDVDMQ